MFKLKNSRIIGGNNKPYYVAELNTSHFGDIGLAKKMIKIAHQVGCDCIKLQSWTSESLYSDYFYKKNPIAKRFVEKYSLNEKNIKNLSIFCKKIGIDFSSTPYSSKEVNFLTEHCSPSFIKVASMDLNNYQLLKHIGSKKFPVVLSTGMGEKSEIINAVKILKKSGTTKICVLHCVSIYPAPSELLSIKNILGLKKIFPDLPIGFSDHTIGSEFAISAVALGASLIEKHLTLDKNLIGMDNQMATEPLAFKKLIEKCNKVHSGLGSEERKLSKQEIKQSKLMRRSVFISKNLKKNHILKISDIQLKRPGNGISPNHIENLINKKINKSIKKGSLLKYSDID